MEDPSWQVLGLLVPINLHLFGIKIKEKSFQLNQGPILRMNPALGQQPNLVSRSPDFLAISSQLKGYVTTHLKRQIRARNHYHMPSHRV